MTFEGQSIRSYSQCGERITRLAESLNISQFPSLFGGLPVKTMGADMGVAVAVSMPPNSSDAAE
jgi:hypothetical protein